jgi:hypothetical protein
MAEKGFSFGKIKSLFPQGIRELAIKTEQEKAWKKRNKELKFQKTLKAA